MKRAIGIPAAVIALVAFPVIVSQATAEKEKPAAAEAALTVNLDGDEGGAQPYRFGVTADGPAPTKAVVLHDATGRYRGELAPGSGCQGTPRIAFPETAEPWCLQIQNAASGHELVGSLSSAAAGNQGARTLKVTVNRRDGFLGLPLVVLIAGLILGATAALLKSALKKPIRRTVLGVQLRENRNAGGSQQIRGLTEFARARLAAGEEIDDVIAKVVEMRQKGPAAAKAARDSLARALQSHEAAVDPYPISVVAAQEAKRDDTRVDDFYDETGGRHPHPAEELKQVLESLVESLAAAAKLRAAIRTLPSELQGAPTEAIARAELVAKEATTPAEVRRVAELLTAARDAFEIAKAKQSAGRSLRRGGEPQASEPPAIPDAPLPLSAPSLGGEEVKTTGALAVAGTLLASLALLALAVFTVKVSNYDPKLTFGSWADYFTLFSAALGSAAAGAVIVLLGFWVPISPEEE